jgi:uncharacterized protein
MLIAILSDSHEHWSNLNKAIAIANERKAEQLIFGGDLMAPGLGTKELLQFPWMIHCIMGNNDGEQVMITKYLLKSWHAEVYPWSYMELELWWCKIFVTHFERIWQLIAKAGEHDLVVYGHNHLRHLEKNGSTILLNPWAILGNKEEASFAFFDTETREVELVLL